MQQAGEDKENEDSDKRGEWARERWIDDVEGGGVVEGREGGEQTG